jgi:hypothetical protein
METHVYVRAFPDELAQFGGGVGVRRPLVFMIAIGCKTLNTSLLRKNKIGKTFPYRFSEKLQIGEAFPHRFSEKHLTG